MPSVKEIYHALKRLLYSSSPKTILELGFCDAKDTIRLARLFPTARIYAFEAHPERYEEGLRRVRRENPGMASRIHLFHAAVCESSGVITLQAINRKIIRGEETITKVSGSSSLFPLNPDHVAVEKFGLYFDKTIEVPSIALDDFCQAQGIEQVDLIWSDIQGAEPLAFRGAQKVLGSTTLLYFEIILKAHYFGLEWYQKSIPEVVESIPGAWKLVDRFGHNILVKKQVK